MPQVKVPASVANSSKSRTGWFGKCSQLLKSNRLISRTDAANLNLKSRVQLEARLTDELAMERAKIQPLPRDWSFDEYRNRSLWRKAVFDFLGPLDGKTILDIGCGYLPTPTYFAIAGARLVLACDVSAKSVAFQRNMAREAGVSDRVRVEHCPVEGMPFASESVDLVHGESALHHTFLPAAGPEIARVLKQDGRAAFKDPLGQNPVLEFARDYLPYSWKWASKGTDRPMTHEDIRTFGKHFAWFDFQGFCLLSTVSTFLAGRGPSSLRTLTDQIDGCMLKNFPLLQRYCRYVVTRVIR